MLKNLVNHYGRYFHTIRYLKASQIYAQVVHRVKKVNPAICLPITTRNVTNAFVLPIHKNAQMVSPNKIMLLNMTQDISSAQCWMDSQQQRLWLYHLHYFDVLNATETKIDWEENLIKRWIRENSSKQGWGWSAYPLSLRIVNWIKWILLHDKQDNGVLASLALQTHYLAAQIEFHILGNHILANAKALLFAGLFFSGKEADKWFTKGLKIFNQQLKEQILPDGGHFELSPMYHAIILEDLLDVINLFLTYNKKIPEEWLHISEKMFFWLENMCHTDGHIAFFNDAILGVASTIQELKVYQERLISMHHNVTSHGLTYLSHSGYCRLQYENILLLIDVASIGASYQPGHAHADTLSFELSIDKQRVFVNSGVSTYAENGERVRQRGTAAHNTILINQCDSSEVWRSFRVARRANVKNIQISESEHEFFISASHDGYAKKFNINHARCWHLLRNKLTIEDVISGNGNYPIELFYHLHPSIHLQQDDPLTIYFYNTAHDLIAVLNANYPMTISDSNYHPSFNIVVPNKKITIAIAKKLPIKLLTTITIKTKRT